MMPGQHPGFAGPVLLIAATQRLPAAVVRTMPKSRHQVEEQKGPLRTIWCDLPICELPPLPAPQPAREPPLPEPDAWRWRPALADALFPFELPRLDWQY